MAGKIFYRERRKVQDGERKPRYRVIAVSDINLKVYTDHLRMSELEHVAEASGADLILARRGPKSGTKHQQK